MSDRFWASITIGGELGAADVREFVEHLQYEFGEVDEEKVTDDASARRWLEEKISEIERKIQDRRYLYFDDSEASYGMFEELEQWCRDHGLSYDRQSEHYGEYDPEYVWWRPGMTEPLSQATLESGEVVIRENDLKGVLEVIRELTPQNVALHINDEDEDKEFIVKCILEHKDIDPLTLIEKWLAFKNPKIPDIPDLTIID